MLVYQLVMVLVRPALWLVFRPRGRGLEHLPREGGFVLAANHLSGWDIFAIGYLLAPRPVRNMGKNQLFLRPLLGPVVRSLGAFPAQEGEGLVGGVAAGTALAREGATVVIFPEGARRRTGEHGPRTGAARIALEARVPLVPAAIRGTAAWRRRERWRVAIGPRVQLDDLTGGDPGRIARTATGRLWEAVTALESMLEGA